MVCKVWWFNFNAIDWKGISAYLETKLEMYGLWPSKTGGWHVCHLFKYLPPESKIFWTISALTAYNQERKQTTSTFAQKKGESYFSMNV